MNSQNLTRLRTCPRSHDSHCHTRNLHGHGSRQDALARGFIILGRHTRHAIHRDDARRRIYDLQRHSGRADLIAHALVVARRRARHAAYSDNAHRWRRYWRKGDGHDGCFGAGACGFVVRYRGARRAMDRGDRVFRDCRSLEAYRWRVLSLCYYCVCG
jgi:hypothetical protein